MTNETTASQPKSIGDDAQFLKRLAEYDAAIYPGQKALRLVSLIALIDSRAPATQASATIQAAPKTSFDDYWWEARHKPRTQKDHAKAAWEFALKSAATIQEPVMVAEPVAWYADTTYDLNEDKQGDWPVELRSHRAFVFGAKRPTSKWDWKPLGDLSELAAPMVADPAGVAFDREEFIRQVSVSIAEMDRDSPEGQPEMMLVTPDELQNTMRSVFDRFDEAATVKAVPSEALWVKFSDKKPAENTPIFWRDGKEYGIGYFWEEDVEHWKGEWLAAPLAGKTDGAQ